MHKVSLQSQFEGSLSGCYLPLKPNIIQRWSSRLPELARPLSRVTEKFPRWKINLGKVDMTTQETDGHLLSIRIFRSSSS